MSRKFASAYQRIAWAAEDIGHLEKGVAAFFHLNIYERLSEPDSDGYVLDIIRLKKELPSSLNKSVVQAIENMRSALDHCACAVVPTAAQRKRTSFPFGDTKRQFEGHLASKAKYVPDDIKSLFRAFKPYQRGNWPLWSLNSMCNAGKHRTLIQPGIKVKDVTFATPTGTLSLRYFSPKWDRQKNQIVVSRSSHGTTKHDVDLSMGIQFGKVPCFGGFEALSSLRALMSVVKSIVMATEAEARRLGIC